ncbi:2782_t:CDS:2, partial [Cetraspora pellucida]
TNVINANVMETISSSPNVESANVTTLNAAGTTVNAINAVEMSVTATDTARMNAQMNSATALCEVDHNLLRKFRAKMDRLKHAHCSMCNESFPSIVLVKGQCHRCYSEKILPKKFSQENNMDPGEVPEELKDPTEIEEMLISQVFTVMSVYRLHRGQYGYRGNVINFPQNVQEFITRLPRHPSSLEVLIVRRKSFNDSAAFKDFNVRRTKVARALQWLKENNRYYADIVIDNEVLLTLPENGPVDDQLPQFHNDALYSEDENDAISRSFVPSLLSVHSEGISINNAIKRVQARNPPVEWPQIDSNPVNEFQTPGYIARAFPTLYPYGRADLRSERIKEVKPAEYFKHLLLYKDGRFARHTCWRYFALNSQMRWRALQEGSVFVRQNLNDDQLTVEEIHNAIANGDNYMSNRIMRYGESLRRSRQFWTARSCELSDMIKQIGSQGLVFFTFSAADLHWPELHKLIRESGGYRKENNSAEQRSQNIINNPHIVSWFFNKRFETFFEEVLKNRWNLEDWWYRFEWQHRGSVHVHGIGKRRSAPVIEWEHMKSDENIMEEVIQYLNGLVTTINPGLNAPVPDRHLCQKNHDEIHDDLQDYIDLINKLQRHTRCSPSYCLRINKSGQQFCRYGYPKEISEHTYLRDDNHGHPELVTKRNDPFVNPHSRLQLQGWRANIDLKPVLSIHAALQYISKYTSKAEPRSTAFSDILNHILCNSRPEDSSLVAIQRLLLHNVAERDISAQETCHLLLGIPLYHSSRSFISLNLNTETPRWLRGTGNNTVSEAGMTSRSVLRTYQDRPVEYEDFSLYKLNLTHKFINNKWVRCERENIIRIWPRPSPLRNGPQWEDFCRIKVILHVRHHNLDQLTENNTVSWTVLYERYLEEIHADPVDLLGPPVDNEEVDNVEEVDEEEQLEDDEQEELRLEWMLLAEMGPRANIVDSSDLGSRSMDRSYDWINETRQCYSNSDIRDAGIFVQQASNTSIVEENASDEIDYQTLNEDQKTVLNRIETHYRSILEGHQVEPLKIIIMGTAGTGKSYLIRAIRDRLRMMTVDKVDSPVLVLAPTGVAAFNINGSTLHSTLSLPILSRNNFDISGERLNQLQSKLSHVKYFIIDEKSMVGHHMLALIDMRLRQAFPEHNNEPFDFGQLPPVLDLPMYANNISRAPFSNDGLTVYKQFLEVYKLKVIQRQSGDSEEQQNFRDILLRLRNGESTITDWETLTTRVEDKLSKIEREQFSDAEYILPKWSEVDKINIEKLKSLNCPIAKIVATHTGIGAKNADSDVAMGLEAQLLLAKGAQIMLTANLWTKAGL